MSASDRALIFDLDGTLYLQRPVQRGMLLRLMMAAIRSPLATRRTIRALQAYRQAQEALRGQSPDWTDLAEAQLTWAARESGYPLEFVKESVARWMDSAPLDLVQKAMRPGLPELLQEARANGWRLGLFSDYPATRKLQAMHLDGRFDVVACAQDPAVQRFKPNPRGISHVRERLEVPAERTVYVGDRADVDQIAAQRAGVRSIILTPDSSLTAIAALWSGSDSSH